MTDELREKLAALRVIAPRLNSTTDEVIAVVKAVEKFFDELSLGVSATTSDFDVASLSDSVSDDEDEVLRVFSKLAYGRVGGRYQVYILKGTERKVRGAEGVWEVIATEELPWSSACRELKLASFECMPELLETIADQANSLMHRAAATTKVVKEVLGAIGAEIESPSARPTLDDALLLDGESQQARSAGIVLRAKAEGRVQTADEQPRRPLPRTATGEQPRRPLPRKRFS
jgi:hypothetical protein